LYRGGIRRQDLMLLVLMTLATMAVAVWISEPLRLQLELYWTQFTTLLFDLRQTVFGAI
jgi:hypothetical protein